MGKEDTLEILSLIRDIKSTLKTLERHDIRNTNNNSYDILGTVKTNKSYINTNSENIKIINDNLEKTNEFIAESLTEVIKVITDYEYENFVKLTKSIKEMEQSNPINDNSKIKNIVKEKIDSLNKNEQEELFDNKIKDLKKLIEYL